jgi:hypothetical protein
VRQLAEHYHKSPDLISEEELSQYFLFLKNVKHYSRNTMTIAICGLKFFFEQTLNKEWTTFNIVRPGAREKATRYPQHRRSASAPFADQIAAIKFASPPSTPAACVYRKVCYPRVT